MKKMRLCLSDIYDALQQKMDDLIFPFLDLKFWDYFVIIIFLILEVAFFAFIVSLILSKI